MKYWRKLKNFGVIVGKLGLQSHHPHPRQFLHFQRLIYELFNNKSQKIVFSTNKQVNKI